MSKYTHCSQCGAATPSGYCFSCDPEDLKHQRREVRPAYRQSGQRAHHIVGNSLFSEEDKESLREENTDRWQCSHCESLRGYIDTVTDEDDEEIQVFRCADCGYKTPCSSPITTTKVEVTWCPCNLGPGIVALARSHDGRLQLVALAVFELLSLVAPLLRRVLLLRGLRRRTVGLRRRIDTALRGIQSCMDVQ
jgi:hypothetical protein